MGFESVGYFFMLLLMEGLTAVVGLIFVAVAWATYFDRREQGQEAKSTPLWSFTVALLLEVLAIPMLWVGFSSIAASQALLVISWILLGVTLFVSRGNPGREIATIKVGCFLLLAIGCIGVITIVL